MNEIEILTCLFIRKQNLRHIFLLNKAIGREHVTAIEQ